MKGHEALIKMRLQGLRPSVVFINDYPCHTDWHEHGDHCTIQIEPLDAPETLDMRFLIGMTVSVSADDENRAKRLLEACKMAKARKVIACQAVRVNPYFWKPNFMAHWGF